MRSDISEVFKITRNIHDATVSYHLSFSPRANSRGKNYELLITVRVIRIYDSTFLHVLFVACIWNNVPNSVVNAHTVNAFKARLDKLWSHRADKIDLSVNMAGIGNRSEEVTT